MVRNQNLGGWWGRFTEKQGDNPTWAAAVYFLFVAIGLLVAATTENNSFAVPFILVGMIFALVVHHEQCQNRERTHLQ